MFTRTDSTKASFAPSTLFSTVGAFTPRLSTLLTSKVSAVLSPSKTSAAYPAAISETVSAGEKRCRTVQAHTALERAREKIVFGAGAKQRERTDDLAADLRGADASVQIKSVSETPPAESARLSKSAQPEKSFSMDFEKSRRAGAGSEEKIKHMGSMPSEKHHM